MKHDIEQRACDLAVYIIENRTTVRAAAKQFGISKSTVHKDLTERLPQYNRPLSLQVQAFCSKNKAERHIRGGRATPAKIHGRAAQRGGVTAYWPSRAVRRRANSDTRHGSGVFPAAVPARFARGTGALLHLTKLRTKIF